MSTLANRQRHTVFIVAHIPFIRTSLPKAGMWKRAIVKADQCPNKYPNVIFLWGHNHSSADPMYDKVYGPAFHRHRSRHLRRNNKDQLHLCGRRLHVRLRVQVKQEQPFLPGGIYVRRVCSSASPAPQSNYVVRQAGKNGPLHAGGA